MNRQYPIGSKHGESLSSFKFNAPKRMVCVADILVSSKADEIVATTPRRLAPAIWIVHIDEPADVCVVGVIAKARALVGRESVLNARNVGILSGTYSGPEPFGTSTHREPTDWSDI